MLKKLDFYFKFINLKNFTIYDYLCIIDNIFDNPLLYNFTYYNPFFIHLVNAKGKVLYCDSLCLTNQYKLNDMHFIIEKFNVLINSLQELSSENNIIFIYISTENVSFVDLDCSLKYTKESIRELEKMYRDINLFDDIILF